MSVSGNVLRFLLGLFTGFLQSLQGHRIVTEIDSVFFLELVGNIVDQRFVEVVTAKVTVPEVLIT